LCGFFSEFLRGQYNLIMSRWLRTPGILSLACTCLLAGLWMTAVGRAVAQEKEPEKQPQLQKRDQAKPETEAKPQTPAEGQIPEEDDSLKPKEYTFNPLQAEKELRVGIFYFHKGSYKAAVIRFREATRWNNNLAEAYLRLGEAEEKEKDWKAAREAYEKYLQLAGEDKRTPEIRKKVGKLAKKS